MLCVCVVAMIADPMPSNASWNSCDSKVPQMELLHVEIPLSHLPILPQLVDILLNTTVINRGFVVDGALNSTTPTPGFCALWR